MNALKKVDIDSLVPYWRNPRDNKAAIEKVKQSIQEYGYQAPIVVDKKMTIIAGHTRYRALKELGWTEVEVIVSDMDSKKAKEYRVIDNRSSEYATWTDDLALELKEFRNLEFRDIFFPEVQLDPQFSDSSLLVEQDQVTKIEDDIRNQFDQVSDKRKNAEKLVIPCPYCAETITLMKSDIIKQSLWESDE